MSQDKVIRITSPHQGRGFATRQIEALKAVPGVLEVVYRQGSKVLLVIPENGIDVSQLRPRLLEVL